MDEPTLPFSPEAEAAVIGSLLIDPTATASAQTLVRADDFHDEQLGEVYRACVKLGQGLDFVTLTEYLSRPEWNSRILGLITEVPTSMHLEHYCTIVHRDAVRRKAIRMATEIARKAYGETDHNDLLAQVQALSAGLLDGQSTGDRSLPILASAFYDKVEGWYQNPIADGDCRYLSSGFRGIDDLSDGLEPKTLITVCARPATGKSALVGEMVRRVGMAGHNALFFSLEMSSEQILSRWASAMSGTRLQDVRKGRGDLAPFIHALSTLGAMRNIFIDDTPALTPSQVRARALARHIQTPLDLIVLDHGGEMMPDSSWRNMDNMADVEGRKTKAMKDLAKEVGCPIILVLQLNRALEGRASKKPTMSDLRSSGRHEEVCDVILGLYRESYYDNQCENPNLLEVLVLKNRLGPAGGTVNLWYDPEYQKFADADVSKRKVQEEVL